MWKRIILAATVATLAGCAAPTLAELTQSKPKMQGTVEQPVEKFSRCVYTSWGAELSVNKFETDKGVRLVVPGTYGVIDISKAGERSQYTYYQAGLDHGPYQKIMIKGLDACL